MLVQTCLICMALADPNILPDEVGWLNTPSMLRLLFVQWAEERAEPNATVLIENWLRTDRTRNYPKEIDGVLYDTWIAPYAWASDLNHDDTVNMVDFGIVAQFYSGGLVYTPPEPAPVQAVPSRLEVIAVFAELLFMQE